MATKTDRILALLPGTFRALPRPTALHSLVDAFGAELLGAENSLAAVMQAHWVDHADRTAELVEDLQRMAALYGLAPRSDESVEEFREHLERYVRTFLEGTVTVQGILRVAAHTLGLRIADAYTDLDTWWTRPSDEIITVERRGDDAAELVLGAGAAESAGSPARRATLTGIVDLESGVDLRGFETLRLAVDGSPAVEVDLSEGQDPASVSLDHIVAAVNEKLPGAAHRTAGFLSIASPTTGPESTLEVVGGDHDAAQVTLGLPPHSYVGTTATTAAVRGTADLRDGIDLGEERYLRISLDGALVAEIDCGAGVHRSLDELRDLVNAALGPGVASHDGRFLVLTSPTEGAASSIALDRPAAQDATSRVFGMAPPVRALGLGPQPARATGRRDLGNGVDLSRRRTIEVSLDGSPSITIDCAGDDPARTLLSEIAAAINGAVGSQVAGHDGHRVQLSSPTAGPEGTITFGVPDGGDATPDIFGIVPRVVSGSAATRALVEGARDLRPTVDLIAQNRLLVSVDGGPAVTVDLLAAAADPRAVTPGQVVAAVDQALGSGVASSDGGRLVLTSPTSGGLSHVAVHPLETTRSRRFTTRATVIDEAASAVLGFTSRDAAGTSETVAQLRGTVDLSRGVDLGAGRHLRLTVDGRAPLEIDCAGPRPAATTLDEVVAKINTEANEAVATRHGRHLVLTSPTSGAGSRITVEPSTAGDAIDELLGTGPVDLRGVDATKVSLLGTVDLAGGVDLPPEAALLLRIDDGEPVEVTLTQAEPEHLTLDQVVVLVNVRSGGRAEREGSRIRLSSAHSGPESRIELLVPAGTDATPALFGISPPRDYHGAAADPAAVTGTSDLGGGADLSTARFLRIAVDGRPPRDVDCARLPAGAPAGTPTRTLAQIVAAVNDQLDDEVASADGGRLRLASPTEGSASRLRVERHTAAGARHALLGASQAVVDGRPPAPAVIVGEVDLLGAVDLSQQGRIRLAVDGGRPVDVDVSGAAPSATFLDEIVAAVNATFPGMASATEDDKLRLESPVAGPRGRLSVLPMRHLELVEYQSEARHEGPRDVRHGDHWTVLNDGAADEPVEIRVRATNGAVGPALVNVANGWQVRVLSVLAVGECVRLRRDPDVGIRAEIIAATGEVRAVPPTELQAGPLGAQATVPLQGAWRLAATGGATAALQLNDPLARRIVRVRARPAASPRPEITVAVDEAQVPDPTNGATADGTLTRLVGRVAAAGSGYRLVTANAGTVIADLRRSPRGDVGAHLGAVVAATGPLHPGSPPVLVVEDVARLFDVRFHAGLADGTDVEEVYPSVTIGAGHGRTDSLVGQVNAGSRESALVLAEEMERGTALTLPRGRSVWRYLDCGGSRFDEARFRAGSGRADRFSGGEPCGERGVFDVSRFTRPPERVAAVFARPGPLTDPPVEVVMRWDSHRPGTFAVNLPADLPARFGARFNEGRFGRRGDSPELFAGAVTEPPDDDAFLPTLVNEGFASPDLQVSPSKLVTVKVVKPVPLGWAPVEMPFRKRQRLTLGGPGAVARLYLAEPGLGGFFIEFSAVETGEWGNDICVTARPSGPARFDVTVAYEAARFESARAVVAGSRAGPSGAAVVGVAPVGVLQAKAAGVRAQVSRDRADEDNHSSDTERRREQ